MSNTPKRWIEFAPDVILHDPTTGRPILDEAGKPVVITSKIFINKLMANPMWNDGYAQGKAQDNILRAFEDAEKAGGRGMWVSGDDFSFLEQAARTPRFVMSGAMGLSYQTGFGFHPSLSRQFLLHQEMVLNAKTEADKVKFEEELAKAKAANSVQATA